MQIIFLFYACFFAMCRIRIFAHPEKDLVYINNLFCLEVNKACLETRYFHPSFLLQPVKCFLKSGSDVTASRKALLIFPPPFPTHLKMGWGPFQNILIKSNAFLSHEVMFKLSKYVSVIRLNSLKHVIFIPMSPAT